MTTSGHSHDARLQDGQIRILCVLPGSSSSPIVCTLNQVWLHEVPAYDALSYVWGDTSITKDVRIRGTATTVTANLWHALNRLRSTSQAREIWIDALCINQKDEEERNAQVRVMGKIYSAARTVYLWIGEADDASNAAFPALSAVAQGEADDNVSRHVSGFYLSLYQRPYFSRIWIQQELALAGADPIVVCGGQQIRWPIFMAAWRSLARCIFTEIGMIRKTDNDKTEVLGKVKIDLLDELRGDVQRNHGQSLRQLLIMARTSECTNPKDRIYGLLGMLTDSDRVLFPSIDYRKPVASIYSDAVAFLFSQGCGPAFLSGMWLPGIDPAIQALPTWSLDFSRQTGDKAKGVWSVGFHPPFPYGASGAGSGAENGVVLDDHITLKVEVLPVDFIADLIYLPDDIRLCLAQLERICQLAEEARAKVIEDVPVSAQMTAFKQSEPLWRIFVSDKAAHSGYDAAPDEYESMFMDLLVLCRSHAQSSSEIELPDNKYMEALRSQLPGRAFFTTINGLVGMASSDVLPGDEITIWFGSPIPFMTRPMVENVGYCQLICGAYVGGIMRGQMVDELYCEDLLDSKTLLVR